MVSMTNTDSTKPTDDTTEVVHEDPLEGQGYDLPPHVLVDDACSDDLIEEN